MKALLKFNFQILSGFLFDYKKFEEKYKRNKIKK